MEYPGVILLGIATGNIAQCLSFFDFFNKKNGCITLEWDVPLMCQFKLKIGKRNCSSKETRTSWLLPETE